jgi:hypothetical protein
VAVEFYRECEGILGQWNFIGSVKLYCGSGIL